MKTKDHRLRVGITLTTMLVLLFALVFSLDSTMSWWHGNKRLEVVFTDVQGLRPNDPVHFHGVPCGRVIRVEVRDSSARAPSSADDRTAFASTEDIAIEPIEPIEVCLTLEVPEEIYQHLRSGSVATIKKTLTGVTILDLTQGDGEPLVIGERLIGHQRATIDDVTEQLHLAAIRLNDILAEVYPMLETCNERGLVSSAIESIDEAGAEARELARSMRMTIEENRDRISGTLTHVANFIDNADAALPAIVEFANEATATVRKAKALSLQLTDWLEDNRKDLDSTVEDVAKAAASMKTMSQELRRRPWRLLYQPSAQEVDEIDLYEAATRFGDSAEELREALEVIERITKLEPSEETRDRMAQALAQLEATKSRYQAFEQKFWQALQQAARP